MPSGPRPSANTRRPDSPPSASMSNAVQPARERLGDDQRPAVRGDDHAVGELDVARDLAQLPVRRDELDVAGLGRRAGDEVEVRAVDVGVATCVDDDLVRPLLGVDGHRPVGLLAPDLVAGRQQPAAGQPVDGVPHRVAGRVAGEHDLRPAVHVNGHDLPVDPVAEPQPPLMPPRRLRNPQATQQNPRFRHDAPLLPVRAGLRPAVYPLHERPRARSTAQAAASSRKQKLSGSGRAARRSHRRWRRRRAAAGARANERHRGGKADEPAQCGADVRRSAREQGDLAGGAVDGGKPGTVGHLAAGRELRTAPGHRGHAAAAGGPALVWIGRGA